MHSAEKRLKVDVYLFFFSFILGLKCSRLLFEESRLHEHLLRKEIKASIFSVFLEQRRISE